MTVPLPPTPNKKYYTLSILKKKKNYYKQNNDVHVKKSGCMKSCQFVGLFKNLEQQYGGPTNLGELKT